MINSIDKVIKYPDITYFDLKNSISNFEDINSQNIILGNGAAEAIFNIVRALKPKKALLPAPTFSEYEEALRSVGAEVEYYYLCEEDNFQIREDYVDKLSEEIDMIFLCNPNNPTGQTIDRDMLIKILDRCKKQNIVVILDECFLEFLDEPNRYEMSDLRGE